MTDLPEMTIASDLVDPEMVAKPRRWDIREIRRFMLTFGLVSSVFDYLTLGVLVWLLRASPDQFRTGWFLESVVSASLIVLVIRTRRPFYRGRPGRPMLVATLVVGAGTVVLPYTPLRRAFGLTPLDDRFLLVLGAIVVLYIGAAELMRSVFYVRALTPARLRSDRS